jgi:23S rRNA pseudouridine1911/1915/1917 synthase
LARTGPVGPGGPSASRVRFTSLNMEPKVFRAGVDEEGTRLDSFIATSIGEISRTRIQRAIEDGDVLVNDHQVKSSYRLRSGDRLEIDLPEPPPTNLLAEPIPLKILYEDDDLVVVDKPAGMVVHPGAGVESGTLANALVYHFNELSGVAGRIRPGIVHRLDKETSGLLVVAKNDYSHEKLSDQFRDRQVYKMYLALVYGRVSDSRGEIEARIGRSPRNRTRMEVTRCGAGRFAHTIFEVAERYQDFTLLRVQIKTGRTHQIRVHLAHIGHPVAGDSTYGAGREKQVRPPNMRHEIQALGRHFLHSARLIISHPRSSRALDFESPLPQDLEDFLSKIG